MFDIGFSEVVIVALVSLIVIGPKQLPEVAEKLGRWLNYLRNLMKGLKQEIAHSNPDHDQ